MASVLSFGQLPEEETEFLAYLRKLGDDWARAVSDDVETPRYEPLPVAEFLARFAGQLQAYSIVPIYIGLREDILNPESAEHEHLEGGTRVPIITGGEGEPSVHRIVGGTKVKRKRIDWRGSRLVCYHRGEYRTEGELAESYLGFYPGTFRGDVWVPHTPAFKKWGKKILDWMRRHTPESVQRNGCNYNIRVTARVAEACKNGLKVG